MCLSFFIITIWHFCWTNTCYYILYNTLFMYSFCNNKVLISDISMTAKGVNNINFNITNITRMLQRINWQDDKLVLIWDMPKSEFVQQHWSDKDFKESSIVNKFCNRIRNANIFWGNLLANNAIFTFYKVHFLLQNDYCYKNWRKKSGKPNTTCFHTFDEDLAN